MSLLLLLVTLFLAGCTDFVDVAQSNAALGLDEIVDGSHTVGQTFVAHHAGLSWVEVWMEPLAAPCAVRQRYSHLRE